MFWGFCSPKTWSAVTRRDLTLLRKPPDYTHKPAPFNESDDSFKEKLHPFKPVQHISQRDVKKTSTFNLRWMQTAKTKVGHVQVIMNALCVMGGVHICTHYISTVQALKREENQREALSKQTELLLPLSSTQFIFQLFF